MTKKLTLILGLGAPLSWLIVPTFTFLVAPEPHGQMMDGILVLGREIAAIFVIHAVCFFGLLVILALRLKRKQKVGTGLILSLPYLVAIFGFWIIHEGPSLFWTEASKLISSFSMNP